MTGPNPASLYDELALDYDRLRTEAEYTIRHYTSLRGIRSHSILFRLKTKESYVAKAGRVNAEDRLVTDLAGVRVVCLYLSDLDTVGNLLRQEFEVAHEDNKIRDAPEDVFATCPFTTL